MLDLAAPATIEDSRHESNCVDDEVTRSLLSLPSSIDLDPEEELDDCFESNTQIEREMQIEPTEAVEPTAGVIINATDSFGSMLSSQGFSFPSDDLDVLDPASAKEAESEARASRLELDKKLMPPPRLPAQLPASTQACCRSTPDVSLDDFGLSSQDFHGIAC